MTEWMPIETAPKDSTPFMALERGGQYVCRWGDWFLARTGATGKREDIYGWVPVGGQPGSQASPTHWMPLHKPSP
jgi:hypothetical protein